MSATPEFHPSPEMIDAVHEWRARSFTEKVRAPIIPLLRDRFDISARHAIALIRMADSKEVSDAS